MRNQVRKISSQDQHFNDSIHVRFLHLMGVQPLRVFLAILVLGIILSAIVISSRPITINSGETDSWWPTALNLIQGNGYSLCLTRYFPFCRPSNQVTAMREPLPVFLFALAALLGKESLLAAEVVEVIIYLSIPVGVYFLTREWADVRSAVLAAFVWIIYLPALELIPQVSGDLFAALCTTLGIFFVFRARKTRRARDWILAGMGLGLATLSRSATLVIVMVVIGGQILDGLTRRWQLKDILKPVLLISSIVILIMAPWLIRNRISLGRAVLGSSLTGYNLYRHNYMITKNHYLRYVGPQEGEQAINQLIARRPDLNGNENEAQLDLVYRGEALRVIAAHPAQYILLSAYRILPLWFDWKIAESYGRTTNRYGYLIMALQAILLILALAGVRKHTLQTWPLWGSISMISLAYMAVDARLLYVMPVMPLLISLSSVGAKKLLLSGSEN